MKLFFFSLFLFIIQLPVFAQSRTGSINGKVLDPGGSIIDFASVALVNKTSGKTERSTQTDPQGNFKLLQVPFGQYILKISFVGYQPYTNNNINLTAQSPSANLGNIKLPAGTSNVLKEVVVQGQKNTMQLGIDRKVFNVDQSIVSEGGSATDLLTSVPTVSVDIDGNVNMRGTSNVKILIDGKPSALAGGNIADVLQSLPASAIENIELITNPSSKYQADGQSGIINIVLKKNQKIGLNGRVSLGAGNLDNYNANTNLSYRDKKVNLYGNYSFRNGNRRGSGFTNTNYLLQNTIINNASVSNGRDIGNNLKIGMDYYLGSKTTLGVSGNMNLRNSDQNEDLNYFYQNNASLDNSLRSSTRKGNDHSYDLNFDYTQLFKRKGEELTGNFSYGRGNEKGMQDFNQNFAFLDGTARDSVTRTNNTENGKNYNIQLDYTLPLSEKVKWEAGYRTSIRNDDEAQLFERLQDNVYNTDLSQTNNFTLEDIVHAVYVNYQNQFTKTFGMQVGLRAEQASLNTEYLGTDPATLAPKISKSNLDYFRVYPSIFLTKKLNSDQQLQLSYTRRVNRPQGWQVNPFIDISDPSNYRAGNPNLKPEDIHSFEFSYAKFWKDVTLTSSVYMRQVNDVVQSIRDVVPGSNAVTITRFYNLTSSQAYGFEFISKADVTRQLSLTGNVNLFYNKLNGNEQYNIKSSDGYNWTANLLASIKLPHNLSAQFNMNYMAPRNTSQGVNRQMFGSDAGMRMNFLKSNQATLSFNVRDVFNSRKFGQSTETLDLIQDSERRRQGRMLNLSLSYRFGKTDFSQTKKKGQEEVPNETIND